MFVIVLSQEYHSHLLSSFILSVVVAAERVSFAGTEEEEEVRRLYGSGFAMKLATERRMAQDVGALGVAGMPSTNMMHDVLTGNDMKIQFEDILSLPEHRPLFVKTMNDPHAMMERKLGMM